MSSDNSPRERWVSLSEEQMAIVDRLRNRRVRVVTGLSASERRAMRDERCAAEQAEPDFEHLGDMLLRMVGSQGHSATFNAMGRRDQCCGGIVCRSYHRNQTEP